MDEKEKEPARWKWIGWYVLCSATRSWDGKGEREV